MRRTTVVLALAVTFAILGSVAPASANDARLVAYVFGANERPGPGDPDGVGRAYVTVNDAANQVCATLQVTNISLPLTGYHIHKAPPGSAGPVVLAFAPPTANQSAQCVTSQDEALLDDIAANPGSYYINVHNAEYPAGAARGQIQPV
jgi:hypothetical protein